MATAMYVETLVHQHRSTTEANLSVDITHTNIPTYTKTVIKFRGKEDIGEHVFPR